MKKYLPLALTITLTILISACSQSSKKSNTTNTDEDRSASLSYERPVTFISAEGDTISTIKAAIADDDQERSQGLMDVRNLPSDKGMLFIFKENKPRGFWMANTPLPLDIIFVNANKQIVRIPITRNLFRKRASRLVSPRSMSLKLMPAIRSLTISRKA